MLYIALLSGEGLIEAKWTGITTLPLTLIHGLDHHHLYCYSFTDNSSTSTIILHL